MAAEVDAYIARFSPDLQQRLEALRAVIRAEAPGATEKMSYQMPTWWQGENLVHFAAHARHIGFYPTPAAIEAFRAELEAYGCSKGAVRFPHDQPLPLDLVRRMVRSRLEQAGG